MSSEFDAKGRAFEASPAVDPPPSRLRRVLDVVGVVVAISGWRLERLSPSWVACGVVSFAIAGLVRAQNVPWLSTAYFAVTAVGYYGGNAVLLGTRLRTRAIARYGEAEAWRRYERTVGVMFMNQGLGLAAMTTLTLPRLEVSALQSAGAPALGALLFTIGAVAKVWSTVVIGVDAYYFKDMFVGRPLGELVVAGPYRVFSHPMYTVGHLHAYGYALLQGSLSGLCGAAVCHLGLFVFYWTAERPFVRSHYGRQKGIRT